MLGLERGLSGGRNRLRDSGCSGSDFWGSRSALRLAGIVTLHSFFFEEAEHVIEDKVPIWLFSQEEALDEFAPRAIVIGHLADNQDGDTTVGGRLCVNRVDEDFAVLEAHRGYLGMYFLVKHV